jgi:hypothetical protein
MRMSGVTPSTTVALTTPFANSPPGRDARALGDERRRGNCLLRVTAFGGDQPRPAPRGRADRQSGNERRLFRRTSSRTRPRTFSSTTMRSVDMQIWPMLAKQPKAAAFTASSDVGVVEDDQRRLAAELEQ